MLDALCLPRVEVLGFSYGGLIAQRLALAHPGPLRRLIIAASSLFPVPDDAFRGWAERDRRLAGAAAELAALSASSPLSGAELTRARAATSAAVNVWRPERLPGYLERLARVRFTASWLEPWQSGALPSPRLPDIGAKLAVAGLPVLLPHGREDMT